VELRVQDRLEVNFTLAVSATSTELTVNVLNTPQFGLPNATIGASNAGFIESVVTPERQLQLALRLAF
jgi:hypothetical protein